MFKQELADFVDLYAETAAVLPEGMVQKSPEILGAPGYFSLMMKPAIETVRKYGKERVLKSKAVKRWMQVKFEECMFSIYLMYFPQRPRALFKENDSFE
jgi:hypothetical protein